MMSAPHPEDGDFDELAGFLASGGPPDLAEDLALARRLAGEADVITTARFQAVDLHVEHKPDLTPVTDADRAVESRIRELLTAERPGDAVLGEELGLVGAGNRRWVVDPIDGTKNFVRGVPVWATLVALLSDGRPVVGVVSAPALGRRWWAARGLGAWTEAILAPGGAAPAEARRCAVSAVQTLEDASLSYSSTGGWRGDGFDALLRSVWRTRAFGDFWSYVLVAEGAVDIACEPDVSVWDLAALQVIVEEAGGRFTDIDGVARPDGGSGVATNGILHQTVLSTLAH
ncbi:MAG: histidinol phosphatase [Actinomycetota bacterium]|nr:histidinol phosphatase [Actinomycetota bacterium]